MTLLALSRFVTLHARGDAAFAWHGLTGDVAEMSRDVLSLLLAFDPARDPASAAVEGLSDELVEEFAGTLRARRFLITAGSDELSALLAGYPRIPRSTVFERTAAGATLYTRSGEALALDPVTARLFLRCDGERTLGQVLGDAGPQALAPLLSLARAGIASLKLLAKPVSQGGVQLNPAAESTMPFPEIPDPRAYAQGGPAPARAAEPDLSFASLFDEQHPALRNRTCAQAIAAELRRRTTPKRVLALGIALGSELPEAQVEASAALLEEEESFDAIVANEVAAGLGFSEGRNSGAIALVRDAARALRPGGLLFLADFGDPKAAPEPGSIRFADLQAEAIAGGLGARVVPLAEALDMDLNFHALSTTRASWPAIQALFAAHGIPLKRRAWLRDELEQLARGRLELGEVHGLLWAPLSERALGLSPRQFWALIAQKPQRTVH